MKYQTTQIMIAFEVTGDGERDLVHLLQVLAWIVVSLWGFWQWVSRRRQQLKGFFQDFGQAVRVAAKIGKFPNLPKFEFSFTFGVG